MAGIVIAALVLSPILIPIAIPFYVAERAFWTVKDFTGIDDITEFVTSVAEDSGCFGDGGVTNSIQKAPIARTGDSGSNI